MIFNSLSFLVFFFIVFFCYWFLLKNNLKLQNIFLLICSYVFYGWWDWRFLSLLIGSSLIDYAIGLQMGKSTDKSKRKKLLLISLISNLGTLFFFKYYNFFIESFAEVVTALGFTPNIPTLSIILPVGISFYTFQTLSYTIDVYKNEIKPSQDIIAFCTFVTFFPQLVAGPIERAKHLLPQFYVKREFDYNYASSGAKLILFGFFKKMVIADKVAVLVNTVYNNPHDYEGAPMVLATFLFAFQIYCDFSGYSDIAIGTGRILGFDLMTNFRRPYYAKSISEFWTRWHISLSTWFKDYIYIPLGGNRVSKSRWSFNIFLTFLISGLWHGASWTFIVWGVFHGLILILERFTKPIRERIAALIKWKFLLNSLSVLITFSIVCIGWIFFRANSIQDAFYILTTMFSDTADYLDPVKMAIKFRGIGWTPSDLLEVFIFLAMLEFVQLIDRKQFWGDTLKKIPRFFQWSFYFILLVIIIFFGTDNYTENFIYFQF